MKSFLLFISLIILSQSIELRNLKEQDFVSYGTGLKNVPRMNQIQGMRKADCFLSVCVIGGLGTVKKFKDAKKWALSNSKLKKDNSIVSDKAVLAKEISQKYNTVYHSNWKIEQDKNKHCYVVNEHGRQVFNPLGLSKKHEKPEKPEKP